MANIQRTPPKKLNTPNTTVRQAQTQSEPDISSAVLMSENVKAKRSKRHRQDSSPKGGQDFDLQTLHETLTSLVAEVKEIKAQNCQIKISNTEICKSNSDIVQSMSFMNKNFEEMRKEIENLKKERTEQRIYIESLEKKINDLQVKTRSSCVEIRNIPYKEAETTASLIQTVTNIAEIVGMNVSASDFRDVYRLPGKPMQFLRDR
ncbi:unnamed protein product [Arctia plantaginis]|uniref:Uncharacterized protein n=1 Tax=Arctia plantaginis TaxID=874455 RepID=A0A8S0Z0B8_ARCPL|nr:unnamed protein product [Arctia plantaginis]